jgi:hypothetical protein
MARSLKIGEVIPMRAVIGILVFGTLWWVIEVPAYAQAELVSASASLLVAIAALLVAVGALIVFLRLAKVLEQMEERFKE